jgi:DNA-binding beta-propeller fold protein YncE
MKWFRAWLASVVVILAAMAGPAEAQVVTLPGSQGSPRGVAVDTSGNVFVADTDAVRKIARVNGALMPPVALPAGIGFVYLGGIAVDTGDNVYVTDQYNNAVWRIALVAGVYQDPTKLPSGTGYKGPGGIAR